MRTLLVIAGLALAAALLHPLEPSVAPATRPPAGTIAFSSFAPRGWDLYVTNVETHQTHRLTDHPALDYNAEAAPRVGRQAEAPAEARAASALNHPNTQGSQRFHEAAFLNCGSLLPVRIGQQAGLARKR